MKTSKWYLIGHAHIDAEWLWTFKETLRVCRDTFQSVLEFMKKYPGFTFCQSSACYYEIMEKNYPEIFDEIKRRVKEGRWEIVGGSWVEFDSNIPSGESLARQFLYGQRYFKEKFGFYAEVGWLPDSFGFSWTLPQIMAKSGIKYFLTQKLSWNDMTYYPFHIFFWESPDGTRILSHQTLGSYSEEIRDENIRRFSNQLMRLSLLHGVSDLLILYGVGDHGGGPRESDLKTLLSWVGSPDLPASVSNAKVIDYFKVIEGHVGKAKIPVVSDELYLQFHRGVYTTQSRFKWINRRSEILLDIVERLALLASFMGGKYPQEELREFWKRTLLHQFHDTISGSGIKEIYEDCERDFKDLEKFAIESLNSSLETISSKVNTKGEGRPILVFNPLPWRRTSPVEIELGEDIGPVEVVDFMGNVVPSQILRDEKKLLFIAETPSLGYSLYKLVPQDAWKTYQKDIKVHQDDEKIVLENSRVKVSIDKRSGTIRELYERSLDLNFIGNGGVRVQIFEDQPYPGRKPLFYDFDAASFDAWEVYVYQQPGGVKYVELKEPEEVKVVENGPVRAKVLVKYRFKQDGREDSIFTIYIKLYSNIPMLYMDFEVDWHAAHRMAKLAIPFSFHSDYTTCEIPFGYIKRRNPSSHEATLYDRAKYEAPCQKWIDYTSESGEYGLSILNDSKYGYDQANNIIRLSLLRSPSYPPKWGEIKGAE
ncbi:MAG: glycoside hydrolase family 38 C-terminal domain-containing protein, partial [Candidatus Bathyarchaeia archaeon]